MYNLRAGEKNVTHQDSANLKETKGLYIVHKRFVVKISGDPLRSLGDPVHDYLSSISFSFPTSRWERKDSLIDEAGLYSLRSQSEIGNKGGKILIGLKLGFLSVFFVPTPLENPIPKAMGARQVAKTNLIVVDALDEMSL
ncbi:MAG TPA: hypothetical protein VMM58_01095 [Bacteroidota bacterium]|nr:hypothetical protein [Bacteroidota bacterium]